MRNLPDQEQILFDEGRADESGKGEMAPKISRCTLTSVLGFGGRGSSCRSLKLELESDSSLETSSFYRAEPVLNNNLHKDTAYNSFTKNVWRWDINIYFC